jgi:hypothetical protein
MKPAFPMIGLEYRQPVPQAGQRYYTDFFYSTSPAKPNSTTNISGAAAPATISKNNR